MTEQRATEPLVRTVDHLKNTTTSMRGLADSVDHLLNALEEFFPFIEKAVSGTEHLRQPRCSRRQTRSSYLHSNYFPNLNQTDLLNFQTL